MKNSPSTRMAEARMAEFQALLTEEEIALGIAEYEDMFGEVPHFLSIESLLEVLADTEGCILDEFRPCPPNPPIKFMQEGEA